jgi:coproporphyrinogen III oxidase
VKQRATSFFHELQDEICSTLERVDGRGTFVEDRWDYAPGEGPGDGGGRSRVLTGGAVFEKAGVNVSSLQGELSPRLAERLKVVERRFFATGVSLVVHPESPLVPTVHMNLRYLQLFDADGSPARAWFGGGADLTPYYPDDRAGVLFHQAMKDACDPYADDAYVRFKRDCDEYFYLPHRGEARGIGGIFFDYLEDDPERTYEFVRRVGASFSRVYPEIVDDRKARKWTEEQREWQLHRRGRYVEFNLIHDRGTLFGLETKGRTESILMSLPPLVRWTYGHRPEPGSPEAQLLELLQAPRDWL